MIGRGVVARNYAAALFELAQGKDGAVAFGNALTGIARLLDEEREFRLFLETPRIATARKQEVLREAFAEHVPSDVLNFLFLVLDRGRQRLIRDINREFQALLDESLGRAHVEVAVAHEMDDATLDRVQEKLSSILGLDVVPHVRVTPELLGGIVFRSGDVTFDGSVRRRLEQLKRQLIAAEVSTD